MTKFGSISALTALILLSSSACSPASEYVYIEPATVAQVGDELARITLTQQAVIRTGVETAAVSEQLRSGADWLTVPYSAVIYHFDGTTWAYTNPEPMVYLRHPIDIDRIEGDVAFLNDGPPVGTTVVTVGAAELYGVEFGVGK